jgi:CBS domain-containing protein
VKAKDVMTAVNVLRLDDSAEDLISMFERPGLRAVPVVSSHGELIGLVTDEEVLRAVLPAYVVEDPWLAAVLEEDAASDLRGRLAGERVKNVVHIRRPRRPPIGLDDTLIEVTSAMVRAGDPAVAVVENDLVVGLIVVDDLLPVLLRRRRP